MRVPTPTERRQVRQVPTPEGIILIRPARRQRAWIASWDDGRFFGRFPTLDVAQGAIAAHAPTPAPCDQRSIAHT